MGSYEDVDVHTQNVCVLRKDFAMANWRSEGAADGDGTSTTTKTNMTTLTATTKVKTKRTRK